MLRGRSGELFGLPIISGEKNLRIRPQGYLFMLRSMLILPDLEVPLKCLKIRKKRIYKKKSFEFWPNHDLRLRICMIFHADSESDLKTSPNHVKNPILLKIQFYQKSDFYGTSTLHSPYGTSQNSKKRSNADFAHLSVVPSQMHVIFCPVQIPVIGACPASVASRAAKCEALWAPRGVVLQNGS